MQTANDAASKVKLRAKKLKNILADTGSGYALKHSESLEVLSRLEGYSNWNSYSAILDKSATLLPLPVSWFVSGDDPDHYEIGCDSSQPYNNVPSATIRSKSNISDASQSMATLMQSVQAVDFRDSRVRLSAFIKSVEVDGAVTIWFRVDGVPGRTSLAFDNLEKNTSDGVLQGNNDWQKREIVLHIPDAAETIHFGFYLRGSGTAYAANFDLQKVGEDVPLSSENEGLLKAPTNLDFQKSSGGSSSS